MDIIRFRKIPLKKVLHSIHLDFKKNTTKPSFHNFEDNFVDEPNATDKEEVVPVENLMTTVKSDMTKQFSLPLPFSDLEHVLSVIESEHECVIVVCIGVSWCYPSRKTLEILNRTAGSGVKVFLLNGDRKDVFARFCSVSEDYSGMPYTFLYWKGHSVKIIRGDKQDYRLAGPLKPSVVTTLLDIICDASYESGNPKEELVIKLP